MIFLISSSGMSSSRRTGFVAATAGLPSENSKPSQGYNADVENLLAASPWTGVALWIILYISDYYLTLYSARGFHEIGHFQFEGSLELTPQYQKDIDAL
jgi:hypothetical protein